MKTEITRITILVDNKAGSNLIAEHGFSLWIESDGLRILFDTGQGAALEKNADTLAIDLSSTDILVLSHGHYDHTGGVPACLQAAGKTQLYCHPAAVLPRYSVRNGKSRSLHMPHKSMIAIDKLPDTWIHWVQHSLLLTDTIGLTGPIPREYNGDNEREPFFLDPKGIRPDLIKDDLALWIRTETGLIVCVGCAHAGIQNTLYHVQQLNNGQKIRAVIGGFHLLNANDLQIERFVRTLKLLVPVQIISCHCTGERAVAKLSAAFADGCSSGKAGMSFEF